MKNVVILVAECFRYDYVPKGLSSLGSLVKTGAAGLYTPTCFSSLLSGVDPTKHKVGRFFDKLTSKTILDLPYWRHNVFHDVHWDAMIVRTLDRRNAPVIELEDIEPPFIWAERLYDSHLPYGMLRHGGGFPEGWTAMDTERYNQGLMKNDNALKEYPKGIVALEEHIKQHLDTLKDRGLWDDTLVVITGDHGELLGETWEGKRQYNHGWPPCWQLIEVPTIWVNQEVNRQFMRQIDIAPTILGILNKPIPKWMDGVDVTKVNPPLVFNNVKEVCLTIWEYKNGGVVMKEWSKDRLE